MAARRACTAARLETETKWAARQGVAAAARLGVGADGQLAAGQAPAGHRGDARREAVRSHRARQRRPGGHPGERRERQDHRRASTAWPTWRSRAAALPAREDGRGRARTRRSSTTWSRVLPSLGVEGVPVTTFARFATRLVGPALPALAHASERGDAAGRVAREVAPGHAAGDRPASWRESQRDVDARVRAAMAEVAARRRSVVAAWERDRGRRRHRRPTRACRCSAAWLGGQAAARGHRGRAAALPDVTRSALEQLGDAAAATRRAPSWAVGRAPDVARAARRDVRADAGLRSGAARAGARLVRAAGARAVRGRARRRGAVARRRGRGAPAALLAGAARAPRGRRGQADPLRARLRRRGAGREPRRASRAARADGQGALHHAGRRRRAADARRGRRSRRVRLERAARRAGGRAHDDRAAAR